METKIKEVQEYFKSKILNKEYAIKSITEYWAVLEVDGKYEFRFWLGNLEFPKTRNQYDKNFIWLDLTESECIIMHNNLLPDIKKYRTEELVARKMKELEELKSESL